MVLLRKPQELIFICHTYTQVKWLQSDLSSSARTAAICFPLPKAVKRIYCSANAVVLKTKVREIDLKPKERALD